MKNLDESFDKKFLDAGVGPKYYLSKSPAEVKSFIRQREKELLARVREAIDEVQYKSPLGILISVEELVKKLEITSEEGK